VRQIASRPAQKISQPSYSPVRSATAVRPITGPTSRLSWSDRWRTLGLATLGGALEFYDFIIFVFFANQIGQLFFPAERAISDVRTFCRRLFCAASVTLVIRLVGIDHLRKRVQVRPLAESDKRDLFLFGVHFQDGLFQDCDVFCGKEISNKNRRKGRGAVMRRRRIAEDRARREHGDYLESPAKLPEGIRGGPRTDPAPIGRTARRAAAPGEDTTRRAYLT
jgi:hypothetical protein